jgi:hypothetical protein
VSAKSAGTDTVTPMSEGHPSIDHEPELPARDIQEWAVGVPDDAGEHAAGLARILQRIPERYGRYISCDAGWYPLIVAANEALEALAADYEIHQVKEKFGGLRLYIDFPEIRPSCCEELDDSDPRQHPGPVTGRWVPAERTVEQQHALDAWSQRAEAHRRSDDHKAAVAELEQDPRILHRRAVRPLMDAVIAAAEAQAWQTCEACGAPSTLHESRNHRYKTLCGPCALKLGLEPSGQH